MIHIFESEQDPKLFCADDISELLADILKGQHFGRLEFVVDAQPPGTEHRSHFVVTKRSDDGHRLTRFQIEILRLENE